MAESNSATAGIAAPAVQTGRQSWLPKLSGAMQRSYAKMRPFRNNRRTMVEEYCTPWYGNDSAKGKQSKPLGLYFQLLATLRPLACPRTIEGEIGANPSGDFDPLDARYPFSRKLKAMNDRQCNGQVGLARTMASCFFDAWFGMGIAKTGLRPATDADRRAGYGDAVAYCCPIDLDNYTVEMTTSRDKVTFESDAYSVNYDDLMNGDWFDGHAKDLVKKYRQRPRSMDSNSVAALSKPVAGDDDWSDSISLRDIWLPGQQRIITTFCDFGAMLDVLHEVEWPNSLAESGPYDVLQFYEITSNIMPLPPGLATKELFAATQRLAAKVIRQAERQKSNPVVKPENDKFGETMRDARDGQVLVGDYAKSGIVATPGADESTIKMMQLLLQFANQANGNPDLLGGISPSSDRVGTNQMLLGGANVRVGDVRSAVAEFGARRYKHLCYYLWEDPAARADLVVKADNGVSFHLRGREGWTPDDRVGEFSDYRFGVNIYQTQSQSPQDKLAAMSKWMNETLIPVLPVLVQGGKSPDLTMLVTEAAKLCGLPFADRLFASPQGLPQELSQALPGVASQASSGGAPPSKSGDMVPKMGDMPKTPQPEGQN